MKSDTVKNFVCEFSESVVPYLYGESSDSERDRFELHMVDCTPCTDEFAELSFSRYSVFEWQKEEFAPMLTPQIFIPYEVKQVESSGFFASLRDLLLSSRATPLRVAATIVIVVGCGFVAFNYFGKTEQQIASVDETNKNVQIVRTVPSPVIAAVEPKVGGSAPSPKVELERVVPLRASTIIRRPKPTSTANSNSPRQVSNDAVSIPPRQDRKSPSLTAGTDDDDKSLRLTDLFEAADTRL